MEQSPRLSLSYVMPSQAQKHVTVNESFRRLDALTQMSVASRSETPEPGSPAEGDAYILPSGASGDAWGDYDEHDVAVFQDGAWARITPVEGFRAWVSDEDEFVVFDGASWSELAGGSAETAAKFGINTTADTTNRLAVKSDAVLFSHDDVTPGSGDCRVIVNKDGAGDTASLLFQTGASGRAEMGLAGDHDFHIKVSPDNFSTSYNALFIDKDNGYVGIGSSSPVEPLTVKGNICLLGGDVETDATQKSTRIACRHYTNAEEPAGVFNLISRISSHARPSELFLGGGSGLLNACTHISFNTAADSTTTNGTTRMRLHSDGGVEIGSPTGGTKGAGSLNAEAVYDDNALLSCYVFDQLLDGAIDEAKWDAKVPDRTIKGDLDPDTGRKDEDQLIIRRHEPLRRFKARSGTDYDPLTLDGYAKHWKEKRHLTAMPNEAAFDPVSGQLSGGEWIQRLVETAEIQAVLIEALNERIKTVEARGRI